MNKLWGCSIYDGLARSPAFVQPLTYWTLGPTVTKRAVKTSKQPGTLSSQNHTRISMNRPLFITQRPSYSVSLKFETYIRYVLTQRIHFDLRLHWPVLISYLKNI